ncbi:DUF4097 family beta strand repeat-containing protein [uncultured Lactobacillus sp.]|uniref:DUF4097 family beta strand repeat-containing protein n=1 Tax=uncultured Lactobacillus sp. TaxID=153152 RepID=UPI0026129D72|nr:DUF4097 family beta strand repeat-containing protein [uncultured Lactobacillus sp.]
MFFKLFAKKDDDVAYHTFDLKAFSSLSIKLMQCSVVVELGADFKATFLGKDSLVPHLMQKDRNAFFKQKNHIIQSFQNSEQVLTITLPSQQMLTSIDIQTNEGNIELVDIDSQRVFLKSSQGRVRVRRSQASEALLETSDGNVTVRNSKLGDGKLSTYNGEIKASGSTLSNMHLSVANGNVSLTDDRIAGGDINLKCGNLTIDHAHFDSDYTVKNIEGTNTVWSVNVKKAQLHTINGQNVIENDPDPSGYVLTMSTVDGDNVIQ